MEQVGVQHTTLSVVVPTTAGPTGGPTSTGTWSSGGADPAPRHRGRRRRLSPRQRRRRVLLVAAELLITLSILVLLYLFWYLVVDDTLISREQTRSAEQLELAWEDAPAVRTDGRAARPLEPRPGEAFAVLRIPRFGQDWRRPVIEGTRLDDLARGVGHYRGTAMPGQVGNFAVAGHRLTHGSAFTRIADLTVGDVVAVHTPTTWYVYRVTGSEIVDPGQLDVIAPAPGQVDVRPTQAQLTLTSCHPLYGSSERYVVHAQLERTQPAVGVAPRELQGEAS